IAIQESSCVGSGSAPEARADCANRSSAGKRLKLTIKAPPPLRNCLRENSSFFICITPSPALSCHDLHRARRIRVSRAQPVLVRKRRLFDLEQRKDPEIELTPDSFIR